MSEGCYTEANKLPYEVTYTAPTWIKRKWWQLWKPRWMPGSIETHRYRVVRGISISGMTLISFEDAPAGE